MDVQVGGAAVRAEVAALREHARTQGWEWVYSGEWFDAMMPPIVLGLTRIEAREPHEDPQQALKLAQARIASASIGELETQDEDAIEDALVGATDEVPEVFHRAAGRAIFVAREEAILVRECLQLAKHTPTQDDLPAVWEIFAAVAGVTPDDFGDEDEEPTPGALYQTAPFGLRRPAARLTRAVGARIIRHALWQTAVPQVGRAVWAGWNDLAARQVAFLTYALPQHLGQPDSDFGTLLGQARREFQMAARLLILGMWSMAVSDASLHHSELETIEKLCVALDIPGDLMRSLRSRSDVLADEFLNELERLAQPEARKLVHNAVISAALADGRLEAAEMEYLKQISARLKEPFDEEVIRTRLAAMHGEPA